MPFFALQAAVWESITAKKMWQGYITNQTKFLTPLYHYTTVVPILDSQGEILEFVGIIQDLTALHVAQEKLNQEQLAIALHLKTEAFLKQIPFAAAILGNDFHIQSYNDTLENLLLRHNDETLLGKLSSRVLSLKEMVQFEEMEYFESVETIFNQWPYSGDATCKGTLKTLDALEEYLIKISPYANESYLLVMVRYEDFELCCQVLER